MLKDSQSTSDNHILVCATMEDKTYKNNMTRSMGAGGVVAVTLDGNLACKAIFNGLKAYSPTEFDD